MVVFEVGSHSVVRIVAAVILKLGVTVKAIPHMVMRIDFSNVPCAFDEISMQATDVLDRSLYIEIAFMFRTFESLHVETHSWLSNVNSGILPQYVSMSSVTNCPC